jgi:hypothetical protein
VSLDILQRSLLHLHKLQSQSQSTPTLHHFNNASADINDNASAKVNANNIADNNNAKYNLCR